MIIIGITGTIGAGKGVVADYLSSKKGFVHYSVRTMLIEEAKKRGLEPNRDTFMFISNDLRRTYGNQIIAQKMYVMAEAGGKNSIIESIRSPGEVAFLRTQKNFILMSIDSDIEIRYERITKRGSHTDDVSFERFKSDEAREMESDDPSSPNLRKCIDLADIKIYNNGSQEDLCAEVERHIITLLNK